MFYEVEVSSCGEARPELLSLTSSVASPLPGQPIQLSVSVQDADEVCGDAADYRYAWTLTETPSGSAVAVQNPSLASPSITPDLPGRYTLRCTVSDPRGLSAFDELSIDVQACGLATPEGAVTFTPIAPQAGDLIALTLTATDDDEACGDPVLSYQWRFLEMPAGSETSLNAPQALTPAFNADLPGLYRLSVAITDETGRTSAPIEVEVTVDSCGSNAPQVNLISHVPVEVNVDQGTRFIAEVSDLDTEAVCGFRAESFSYHWTLSATPAGSEALLRLAGSESPSLSPDLPGDYEVTLSVTDARGLRSESAQYTFTVGTCGLAAPTATITATPNTPPTGGVVHLEASPEDADTLLPCVDIADFTYEWSFDEVPVGSEASLNAPNARTPSFSADVTGTYTLRLLVTDARGTLSEPIIQSINTAAGCGDNPPQIDDLDVTSSVFRVDVPVSLNVDASDADNDVLCAQGQSLSYRWRFVSSPAGSAARILNSDRSTPSFIPDTEGDYQLGVIVTDPSGRESSDQLTVTISDCGLRTPTLSNLSLSTANGRPGVSIQASADVDDLDNSDPDCALDQDVRVEWQLSQVPAGSLAQLNDPSLASPSFSPDLEGVYVIRSRAVDQTGLMSAWQSAQVSVNRCGLNAPTIAQAQSAPAQPNTGDRVRLSAVTDDSDNDVDCALNQSVSYAWRLVSQPNGASTSLNDPTIAEPEFTAALPGTYTFDLTIIDDLGLFSEAFVLTVNVATCGDATPVVNAINSTPIEAQIVLGDALRLSSNVTDADEDNGCNLTQTFEYHWMIAQAPSGSLAQLSDPSVAEPSLTPDVDGDYLISLMVVDQSGRASATFTETFTVADCGLQAPEADIDMIDPQIALNGPVAVSIGEVVQLDGGNSQDPDDACGAESDLTYEWVLLRVPPASLASLALPSGITPWFIADVDGTYSVQLIVHDGTFMSAPVTFEVIAQ